ncbi:MAG: hemerythrin domain-containing protein [Acidimicrobiia bacterium]
MARSTRTSAVGFLQEQHDRIRELFATVATGDHDTRREAFEQLVRLLAVHETAEEVVVHPAARLAGDEARQVVAARLDEEDKAKKMLADIEKHDPSSPEFAARLPPLRDAVETHARNEERELFPLLERTTDERQLERMTSALQLVESIAPTHPHKLAPESALGNLAVGPVVGVIDRVRDMLRSATR